MDTLFTSNAIPAAMSARSESEIQVDDYRLSAATYRERLKELPPSAKLVAKVLEIDSPLTHAELVEESLLPDRTVRYALDRLEGEGLVNSRTNYRDTRKQIYAITR